MNSKEYTKMAGLNLICPNCKNTIVYELKNDRAPIVCTNCKTDISDDPIIQEQIEALKKIGALL